MTLGHLLEWRAVEVLAQAGNADGEEKSSMTRLPSFAERYFAAQVSDFDGLCHRVEEDESGWDYVVELPAREYDGPAESQPPRQRAFVQVKSIQGAKASVPITLSNLRKSAQDPNPWFIVLIKKRQGTPILYIKHFWKHLIESSLIAIRKAEGEGAKLNKRTMSISFTEDDIVSHDFIRWMQDRIDESDDYLVEKRRFYTDVGHEKGYGIGRMLFTEHTNDEIFKEFLGIGNGLRISSFEYVPERFSLPDYSRKISETGGTVYITPQPQGTCEVRFRSSPIDPRVRHDGNDVCRASRSGRTHSCVRAPSGTPIQSTAGDHGHGYEVRGTPAS